MKQILLIFLILLINIKFTNASNKSLATNILYFNHCDNSVITEKPNEFQKGDLVLIIQMNGAIIDRSNTDKYGDIIDLNGAGQFELNEILGIENGKLKLKYKIKDGYDFSATIQFIKVPKVKNLTISEQPEVTAWDGKTGGVLVLYAEDTLTLNTNIDLTGKGFRGGALNQVGDWDMSEVNYFYKKGENKSGNKGEGITINDDNYIAGKGKNANGGGGGNAADAGGGGGGNLSFGGNGGFPGSFDQIVKTYKEMGIGGGLVGIINKAPLIMGGGGGAGSANHNLGTTGENGGGVIIIFTNILNGNSFKIISNGNSVLKIAGTDGSGGGGGAGSIFINFEKIISKIYIELNGGKGGDTDARGLDNLTQDFCHGPGGGGGGGTLYLNKESLFIESILKGGNAGKKTSGTDTCSGTNYGAKDGQNGLRIIKDYKLIQDTIKQIPFHFIINYKGNCNDFNIDLSIEPKDSIKQILWSNGFNQKNIKISKTGNYYAEVIDINGCFHLLDTLITELNTNSNYYFTEVFTIDKYEFAGYVQPKTKGIILADNKSNQIGAIWLKEKLNVTQDFTISFGFKVYNGFNNFMFEQSFPGADGFALIFQNHTKNALGQSGGGIGYTGIPNSLAIELDLFGNYLNLDSIFDPNGNHLGIFSNKTKPNISNHKSEALLKEKLDIIEVLGDSTYYFNVEYLNKNLRVSISKDSLDFSNSLEILNFDFRNYVTIDESEYLFLGISAATGTAHQTHELLNWSICGDTKLINTSINNTNYENKFLPYPNPVKDKLFINDFKNIKLVKITNTIGTINLQFNSNEIENKIINIENLASGIYFIEIINNHGDYYYSKFIKE